jgi:hypothetical protein
VDRTADHVADQQVREAHLPTGKSAEHRPEVRPVESDPGKLKAPEGVVPGLGSKQVRVRVGIQVEASQGEDDVVQLMPERERCWVMGAYCSATMRLEKPSNAMTRL